MFTGAFNLQYCESVCFTDNMNKSVYRRSNFTVLWISVLLFHSIVNQFALLTVWTPLISCNILSWLNSLVPLWCAFNWKRHISLHAVYIETNRETINRDITKLLYKARKESQFWSKSKTLKDTLWLFFCIQSYLNKNSPFYKPWRFSHRHLPPLQYQSHLHVLLKL